LMSELKGSSFRRKPESSTLPKDWLDSGVRRNDGLREAAIWIRLPDRIHSFQR